MKLFTFFTLLSLSFVSLHAEDSKTVTLDSLKIERLKLQVKSGRIADQFKQLQLGQQELAKQYNDLQLVINTNTEALKAFCESKKLVFIESADDFGCEAKKEDIKPKEVKK